MRIQKDIVILGGGIAGLWLLNRLRTAGYAAVLLERAALGTGQSVASQGMIHGGMKYALGGALTGASESIADMPAHWQRCLRGEGDVDLRGTGVLSDAYYMWPRNSVRSRLNAFFGSKAVRGKVTPVPTEAQPAFFRGNISGPLYRLHDIVLDVPSLLATLGELGRQCIHQIDWHSTGIEQDAAGNITCIKLADGVELHAQRFITTAGAGTEDLLRTLAPPAVAMQKRPLQMVVVKHHTLAPLYVHCVSDQLSATPEVTLTTHRCQDGAWAWYLGGELAEAGATLSSAAQLQKARHKLAELFPWCDLGKARWHSFPIDRAEAAQPDGKRPDQSSVLCAGNVLFCWPTKLTLAPNMANTVINLLAQQQVLPRSGDAAPLPGLRWPGIALAPWDAMP